MKDVWILSVKTTLPNGGNMTTALRAFADFKAARDALRATLRGYAFQKNAMFDGKGGMIRLNEYLQRSEPMEEGPEDYVDEEELTYGMLKQMRDALEAVFRGEDCENPLADGFYTDYMMAIEVDGEIASFRGDDDGPFNGIDPTLDTNMFSMAEQKDWYYLYIDDCFGQNDCTAELYIDLKKAEWVE